jgi:hypothetical protein
LGCSSQESEAGGRGAGGKSLGDGGVGGVSGYDYPSGPYGKAVGDVVADLQLLGYVRTDTTGLASDAALGPVSFGSIRQSTDKTHALIHVSGFT